MISITFRGRVLYLTDPSNWHSLQKLGLTQSVCYEAENISIANCPIRRPREEKFNIQRLSSRGQKPKKSLYTFPPSLRSQDLLRFQINRVLQIFVCKAASDHSPPELSQSRSMFWDLNGPGICDFDKIRSTHCTPSGLLKLIWDCPEPHRPHLINNKRMWTGLTSHRF